MEKYYDQLWEEMLKGSENKKGTEYISIQVGALRAKHDQVLHLRRYIDTMVTLLKDAYRKLDDHKWFEEGDEGYELLEWIYCQQQRNKKCGT